MVPRGSGPAGFLGPRAEGGSGRKAARGLVQVVSVMCRYAVPKVGVEPRGVAGTMLVRALRVRRCLSR